MSEETNNPHTYTPPVSDLLPLGRPEGNDWLEYVERYDFTTDHIPELGRLATDESFWTPEYDERPEPYASIHAFRALGQLRDPAALPHLIHIAETEEDSDWVWEGVPVAVAMIGPAAIPLLKDSLDRTHANLYTGGTIVTCLEKIGLEYPERMDECAAILSACLEKAEENDPAINGNIIATLLDFKATDALPVIEQAFAKDAVDIWVVGDWDDVQVEFGLKAPDPNKKRPPMPFARDMLEAIELLNAKERAERAAAEERRAKANAERKAQSQKKAKRKQAQKQKKQQRKRKK